MRIVRSLISMIATAGAFCAGQAVAETGASLPASRNSVDCSIPTVITAPKESGVYLSPSSVVTQGSAAPGNEVEYNVLMPGNSKLYTDHKSVSAAANGKWEVNLDHLLCSGKYTFYTKRDRTCGAAADREVNFSVGVVPLVGINPEEGHKYAKPYHFQPKGTAIPNATIHYNIINSSGPVTRPRDVIAKASGEWEAQVEDVLDVGDYTLVADQSINGVNGLQACENYLSVDFHVTSDPDPVPERKECGQGYVVQIRNNYGDEKIQGRSGAGWVLYLGNQKTLVDSSTIKAYVADGEAVTSDRAYRQILAAKAHGLSVAVGDSNGLVTQCSTVNIGNGDIAYKFNSVKTWVP